MIRELDSLICDLFDLVEPILACQATRLGKGRYWQRSVRILEVKEATSTVAESGRVPIRPEMQSPKLSSMFDISDSGYAGSVGGFSQISTATFGSGLPGTSKATSYAQFEKSNLAITSRLSPLPERGIRNEALLLPSFMYETLPYRRRSVRLLNIFASSPDNPQIECQLVVVNFDDKWNTPDLDYEVLSWHWGTATTKSHIKIKKGRGLYTKNVAPELVAALREVRHPFEDRYIWVDALCINQDDFTERNGQVEMMPVIYGRAKRLCIWLGEGDASSATAFRFISDEVLQLQDFDELCESVEAAAKWKALLDLMQRPWFSRRWAIQEISLAREAVLYCGEDKINWKDFATAVELFLEVESATHRLSDVLKKDPQFFHVPGWFEYASTLGASLMVETTGQVFAESTENFSPIRNYRKPRLTLEHLVSSLSIFDVNAEHDTIYAFLNLASDAMPSTIDPGMAEEWTTSFFDTFSRRKRYTVAYESPYVDACKTFIQFCIHNSDPSRALDILCRPWAAAYDSGQESLSFKHVDHQNPTITLPSWISGLSGASFALHSHPAAPGPTMARKNADSLVGLPTSKTYNAAESKRVDRKRLRFRKRTTHFSLYVTGFVLDTISEILPASQAGVIPEEWLDAMSWENSLNSDPPEDIWRTLVADRGRHAKNPPVYYSRAWKETILRGGLSHGAVNTSDLINNGHNSIVAEFCRRVQAVIWNRRLIKTKSNNIGLVNKKVQAGDSVCILYGCSVPVILRRSRNKKTKEELKQEREDDFVSAVVMVQRRWRIRLRRNRRIREKYEFLLGQRKILGRGGNGDFYLMVKYGKRWKSHARFLSPRRKGSFDSAELSKEDIQRQKVLAAEAWNQHYQAWLESEPDHKDHETYHHYEFLGEAYIHGMMDGQAISFQIFNNIPTQAFELR
jgi:hypothetical protein